MSIFSMVGIEMCQHRRHRYLRLNVHLILSMAAYPILSLTLIQDSPLKIQATNPSPIPTNNQTLSTAPPVILNHDLSI